MVPSITNSKTTMLTGDEEDATDDYNSDNQ